MSVEHWYGVWKGQLAAELPRLWMIAALFVVLGVFELMQPAQARQGWKGRARNLLFAAVFVLAGSALWAAILEFRTPSLRVHDAGSTLRSASLLLGYLFVTDFVFYWYHRAQHRFSWLWAVHELHHADAELNVTTSLRIHWLDFPLQAALVTLPTLMLLGIDRTAGTIYPFVQTATLLFGHWNLRLHLGRLTPVLVGPQVHRLHHSTQPEHRDRNFAQVFPLLDIVFGTWRRPGRDEYPPTGAEGLASDASPWRALLLRPIAIWSGRDGKNEPPLPQRK